MQYAEEAVQKAQEDMKHIEYVGSKNRESEKRFYKMMVTTSESLCDVSSFDKGEIWESQNVEVIMQGKPSDNNEPGRVMGTITKPVQQGLDRVRQKQMKHDELTQAALN